MNKWNGRKITINFAATASQKFSTVQYSFKSTESQLILFLKKWYAYRCQLCNHECCFLKQPIRGSPELSAFFTYATPSDNFLIPALLMRQVLHFCAPSYYCMQVTVRLGTQQSGQGRREQLGQWPLIFSMADFWWALFEQSVGWYINPFGTGGTYMYQQRAKNSNFSDFDDTWQ